MRKNVMKIDLRFYDWLASSKLMFCFFLHVHNKLIMLPLAINIKQGCTLSYWQDGVYRQKGCH